MKSSKYIFSLAICSMALAIQLNADVVKPHFQESRLPAIWNASTPQQRLKALRVAQLDAYRALLERVYGFQLNSGTTVYDCALSSDKVRTNLSQVLKGATELEKPQYNEHGMVMVVYGLKLQKVIEAIKKDKDFEKLTISKSLVHQNKIIEALGCGALPNSKGMKMLLAKRAAELDAYRLMAERIIGVKINSDTSVADMCLKSDKVQASLVAYLKGLKPTSITYSNDNSCAVTVQLKIREVVKTVEELVRIYNSGKKDKITNTEIATNDKIFTVTGNGAPRDKIRIDPVDDIYRTERNVLQQVLKKEVIVE